MNSYQAQKFSRYVILAFKIIILILGLCASYFFLDKFFIWFFAIAFVVVRWVVVAAILLIIFHLLLKILFKVDLFRQIMDRFFPR